MKYKEIGRYFLYICKKETFYIYVYIYLGQIGYDRMVVMMDYRPTAVFGWFAIRDIYYEICRYWISGWDGNMDEGRAKIERVGWTAMRVKVEQVS